MSPFLVAALLVGLVAVATALGLLWRAQDGRVRRPGSGRRGAADVVVRRDELPAGIEFGSGATLLQFSTEVCSPCAATRVVLGTIAGASPAVAHVDLDIAERPDLANRFNILQTQTPTTLILDGRGIVRARIGGAARPDAVRRELDLILA